MLFDCCLIGCDSIRRVDGWDVRSVCVENCWKTYLLSSREKIYFVIIFFAVRLLIIGWFLSVFRTVCASLWN